jgi:hypothetical protein
MPATGSISGIYLMFGLIMATATIPSSHKIFQFWLDRECAFKGDQ